MQSSPINFFIVFTILVISIILIYSIVKIVTTYINKKNYTRERFAFFSVTTLLSVCLLFLGFLKKNYFLEILNFVIQLLNKVFNWKLNQIPITEVTLSLMEYGFIGFIFYLLTNFLLRIFRNWSGGISDMQHEDIIYKENINIYTFFEAAMYFAQKSKNLEPKTLSKNVNFDSQNDFALLENSPWHIQAAELLQISSTQFKINIENDWYRNEFCYVSFYGKNSENIGILCTLNMLPKSEILQKIDFVNKIAGKAISKFIICVKNDFIIPSYEIANLEIQYYSEKKLLQEIIDFHSYRQTIIDKFEKKEIINGYKLTLNDTYVPPSGEIILRNKEMDADENQQVIVRPLKNIYIKNLDSYIKNWLNQENENKQLAILGEYGQGKSVLAQRICYLIFKGFIRTDRIPILITLGGKYPKHFDSIRSFFADWAHQYGFNPEALTKLHYAGKLLIIFDGFDETELIGEYFIRLEHFRKIWKFNTLNSKIIITGRPNYFVDNNELVTLLRTHEKFKETQAYCEEIHLRRFNLSQIKSALRSQKNETVSEILELLKKTGLNSSFYDLLSRPSHLFLASIIWEKELTRYKENINSARVYECFIRDSSLRQEKKQLTPPLTLNERNYFMIGIALNSLKVNGFTNIFDSDFINRTIEKLIAHIPNDINKENQILLGDAYKEGLTDRINKNLVETITNDVRSCGIIVRDLATFNHFRFAHKSFFEYFVSNFYQFESFRDTSIDRKINNSIKNALEIDKSTITLRPEIFKFVAEILTLRISGNSTIQKKHFRESALSLYSKLYPYKIFKNNINLAFAFRDLTRLSKFHRIFYSLFLSCTILLLFLTIFNIVIGKLKFDGFNVLSLFFIFFSSLFVQFILVTIKNRSIQDSDNLLLWYGCCCQLNIDRATFYRLIGKKRYRILDKEYKQIMSPELRVRVKKNSNLEILVKFFRTNR